jgi:hypothetical protein
MAEAMPEYAKKLPKKIFQILWLNYLATWTQVQKQ